MADTIDQLDLDIAIAQIAVTGARERHRRCPSGENEARVQEAEAEVDRLLDLRLAQAEA